MRRRTQATSPTDILPGTYEIDSGIAQILPDPYTSDAWLLLINGAESSQLIPDYPERLGFEYMRWAGLVITHRYATDKPLRFLHLGGAGCNMARWGAHVYPNSTHTAVELDARLAELARNHFGLPRAPRLKIRVAEAGEVLAQVTPESRDVVIRDVFTQDVPGVGEHFTPKHLTGLEATQAASESLGPEGLYIINYGGPPGLAAARAEAATMREVFPTVALISDPSMFKARRRGNILMIGTQGDLVDTALGGLPALRRQLLADPQPAHLRHSDEELTNFIAGAAPNNTALVAT